MRSSSAYKTMPSGYSPPPATSQARPVGQPPPGAVVERRNGEQEEERRAVDRDAGDLPRVHGTRAEGEQQGHAGRREQRRGEVAVAVEAFPVVHGGLSRAARRISPTVAPGS